MRSIFVSLTSRSEFGKFRNLNLASFAIPIFAGIILSLLILMIGPKSLPIVLFTALLLPWLIKDAFRLFVWLIITWPILTLYIRIPLPAGIPDIGYDRVFVLLLLTVVLVEALLSKRKLTKVTPLDILIIIYVIAQSISRISVIWFGGVGYYDLNGFLDVIIVPVILYWLVKNLLASEPRLKWILYTIIIAALLVCPTGLYEQMVGVRIFKASLNIGGSEVVYQWRDAQGGLRAAGALANPAIYGAVLGMGSLAGMCCLPLIKQKTIQLAFVAVIGFLLIGVIASYTRSVWISVIFVLFFAQFFINGLWKKTLPFEVIGLLLLVIFWNLIPGTAKLLERALTTKTITQRFDLFAIALQRFLEKPFLGWGSGALNVFDKVGAGEISHNIYLTYLVDGGVVLFLSFIAVVAYILIKSMRIYQMTIPGSIERNVLVAMVGCIIIFLLSGLALELRYFGYFNSLFWISAGVIDYLGTHINKNEPMLAEKLRTD